MTKINLTPEQLAIISHCRDTSSNLVVDAKAGSGKTSTILLCLPHLRGTVSLQAFNKAIAVEMQAKANLSFEDALRVSISTVHSHGLSAFRKSGMKPQTLSGKLNFMLKDILEAEYDGDDDIHRNRAKVTGLTSHAKNAGFGLTSTYENFPSITDRAAWHELADHFGIEDELVGSTTLDEVITLSIQLLTRSNARVNSIDFDDMIYLPLLHNMNIPTYDNILIDEAQDINATRREMAFRSMTPNGRLIAVGDPKQAIYGFTGADPRSLDKITSRAKATTLPLSICWRCDALIIKEAQHEVPTIQARPNAPDGQVLAIDFTADKFLDLPKPGDAILCRLNKPNVAVALGLLRRGERPRIEGRDLGKRLLFHVQRANEMYAFKPLADTQLDLAVYQEAEVAKLAAKNREAAIPLLEDEIEAASLLIDRCIETNGSAADYKSLESLVENLFGDQVSSASVITLSSVHKAKGREWKRVFILGYDDYMPFSFGASSSDWEMEQEYNLIYVAKTRAEKTLVYVNGAKAAIDAGTHRAAPKPVERVETITITEIKSPSDLNAIFDRIADKHGVYDDLDARDESTEQGPDFLYQTASKLYDEGKHDEAEAVLKQYFDNARDEEDR